MELKVALLILAKFQAWSDTCYEAPHFGGSIPGDSKVIISEIARQDDCKSKWAEIQKLVAANPIAKDPKKE